MTDPSTPAGRDALHAVNMIGEALNIDIGYNEWRKRILAIEAEARAECRDADHIGQIAQLGEMVDAARAEAEQARAEGRREATRMREALERLTDLVAYCYEWDEGTDVDNAMTAARAVLDAVAGLNASEPQPVSSLPVRMAGDNGPETDHWTCSCGLTRPVTGSYGCADCGDGRPDSWERVDAASEPRSTDYHAFAPEEVWAERMINRWNPDEQSQRVEQRARELAGSNHQHGAIPARFWRAAIVEFATTSLLAALPDRADNWPKPLRAEEHRR